MHDSRKTTKTGRIPSPQTFRAAATGIGSTFDASVMTGAIRAQRVANSCDPQCAKMLPRSYPAPYAVEADAGRAMSKRSSVKTTHLPPATDDPMSM